MQKRHEGLSILILSVLILLGSCLEVRAAIPDNNLVPIFKIEEVEGEKFENDFSFPFILSMPGLIEVASINFVYDEYKQHYFQHSVLPQLLILHLIDLPPPQLT